MPVPDYQSLFLPVLRVMADGSEHSMGDLRERIATDLRLSPEDLSLRLPSGTQTVFANRVAWSAFYLHRALALERTRRGVLRITPRGRELLEQDPPKVSVETLSRFPEFVAFRKRAGNRAATEGDQPAGVAPAETPEEQLAAAHSELRRTLVNELLDAVRNSTPTFFEELVIDLLVAMGYGGTMEDAGKAVGRSGDGGIDGIIKEDKLGLDVVYIQAKRWSAAVGRPVVQAFAGSLEGVRARKGVLITTSYFSQEALEYVRMIEKRIVLIDGEQLADLMIDHDVGVTVVGTYKVKRLNSDYFDRA